MKTSLTRELMIITVLSLVLAVGNNLLSSAKIAWVRHWTPYSALQHAPDAQAPAPAAPAETPVDKPADTAPAADAASPTPEPSPEPSAGEKAGEVARRVVTHEGISDIGLAEAYELFRYAPELTLWIDARGPELYEEGHIQGAHLLHFYDQDATLEDIRTAVAEKAPEALVVYCKGKDCTDSHHLAEDLMAREGFGNIFVYKDGFDDWFTAGYPVEGTLAADGAPSAPATAAPTAPETDAPMDAEKAASVPQSVLANQGITDIGLAEAYDLYRYAADLTFWIDARDPELFEQGHIRGAELLHFYDQEAYLAAVSDKIAEKNPEALVIYCKGKDCTDSHHLAEDLLSRELGGRLFQNIFVYKDGYDDWFAAGYPIDSDQAPVAGLPQTVKPRVLPEVKPPGMYLEHIVRDLLPFLLGLMFLFSARTEPGRLRVWFGAIVVGAFFIWAAYPKMQVPLEFAKNIWNYDIVPGNLVNLSALILPAFEMICGICLISGLMRRGGGLIVSALLVIFIVAVGYNVARGHEFNCGCTATTTMITDIYFAGWNDKYTLILRDIGLLVMSWTAFRHTAKD